MRLLVTLVLVVASGCSGHYLIPVEDQGQVLTPHYYYVVQHTAPQLPDVLRHPEAEPVSRETLEDQGPDRFLQNIPDISDEQAHLNPDDSQHHQQPDIQRPVIPSPPRPTIPRRPVSPPSKRPAGEESNVVFNGPNQDGSYDFSYSQGDQRRTEKSDSEGNVEGSYSYQGPDGKEVTVTYTAGANKGYIPEGEGLLPPPPAHPHGNDEGAWEDDDSQNRQQPDIPRPVIPSLPRPSIPQRPLPISPPSKRPPGEESNVVFNGPNQDGSYDFSCNQADQRRTEKSDSQGNVQGTYSYKGGDGKEVTVTYTAGANKGYIPEGEGLLPPPPAHPRENDGQEPHRPQIDEWPEDTQQHLRPVVPTQRPSRPQVHEEPNEEGHGGMPYSYNYDAELSSKKETADDNGNVEGSYTYVDGAGITRTVTYTVNGDEGFVARGDIHPDPGTPDVTPARPAVAVPVVPHAVPRRPSHPRGDVAPAKPEEGVKGRRPEVPRPRPVTPPPARKGGNTKGGSWDKYPLGR